ncbi:hypothetical protein CWE13_00400 [Aliidiomarina shirensis]|uniref:Type II toxin-antitoxin system RelE/ParE family toxin n=1 Tax=Aliidiomarina shirensis TaxID=1048642 RepID=A0A432WWJ7_9GAMM|nr:hypothetical protein [Aliidiomarina shirensis]RUO38148.1 hypothetical protein CWE13_00400 [Aliidiomarina shirensis]
MAPKQYNIVASPVFKRSLQRLRAFLSEQFGEKVANSVSENIKLKITEQLTLNTFCGPISERLFQLGLTEYRQLLIDEHNLVFYVVRNADSSADSPKDTDNEQEVQLLLVMDSRQSIQKLLFELNLLM